MADFLKAPVEGPKSVGKVVSKDGAWSAYGLRPVESLSGINLTSHIVLEGNIVRHCEICGEETKKYCTYDGGVQANQSSEVTHGVVAVCGEDCKKELLKKLKLEKKIERYHTGFRVFDRDGDGSITIQELADVMRDLGATVDESQLTHLVGTIDKDNSGTIEFEEFLPLLTKMLGKVMHSLSELKHLQTIEEDKMSKLKKNLRLREVHRPESKVKVVVLLVVVAEEILPVLEKFKPERNEELEGELLKLAKVFTTTIKKHDEEGKEEGDSYTLHVLQVADSPLYNRHYSGYTQSSAIVSITAKVINPDLLVSFGTAGGTVGMVNVGDAVLANGCVFVDRVRTSSKTSHDWGVFGGPTMPTTNLAAKLGLREGLVGSQISYNITELQESLIEILEICAIDMEAAPEAQIAMQIPLNFIAIKVISNGIYPGDGSKMEKEYIDHKLQVSQKGVEVLGNLFEFLVGKHIKDL